MALMPKRVKFRKQQRGKLRGVATRGNYVAYGEFGLQCLDIGWLSARQNLFVASVNAQPAGYLCFSVQPALRDGTFLIDDAQVEVEASVDGSAVDAGFDRGVIAKLLLEAAMNRALELGCKKFHGKNRVIS